MNTMMNHETTDATPQPIAVGDFVTKVKYPGVRCRVTHIYPDGDLAAFEVVRKDGKRDGRWSASGGFTGSLRWWKKVEEKS